MKELKIEELKIKDNESSELFDGIKESPCNYQPIFCCRGMWKKEKEKIICVLRKLRNDAYNAHADSSCNEAIDLADEILNQKDNL